MKFTVMDYAYVDEDVIAEEVINNYTAPFTEDNILTQINEYIECEEEDSLVHHLTENQIQQLCDTVMWVLSYKGYKVV